MPNLSTTEKLKQVLVILMVDEGYNDEVLKIAKELKTGRLTLFRGSGNFLSRLTDNKELIIEKDKNIFWFICDEKKATHLMKSLYKQLGINTKARGMVCELPLNDVVGLYKEKEEAL